MNKWHEMKFLRRVLLVTTPVGMYIGLQEAYRLTNGFVILMAAQFIVLGLVIGGLVRVARREAAAEAARRAAQGESR